MNTVRTFALASVAAGAVVNAMHYGTPQGEVIEMFPRGTYVSACVELPKLCTGAAMMHGLATTLTYLCPEVTASRERSTVHVTVTETTTVTPPRAEPTADAPGASSAAATVPVLTEEPESTSTSTIHTTVTKTTTVTRARSSSTPPGVSPPTAAPITSYLSATIPSELTPRPIETEDPEFTIQTSTTPNVTPTSDCDFPTMLPPVFNGTTTGVFYSASVTNSSLVQPTPFFPNATSYSLHILPTLNVENRAAENGKEVKGAAKKLGASLATLVLGVAVVSLSA